MKYIRLPNLTNTYPQTGNYINIDKDKSALFGLYDDINKIDFTYPNIAQIKIVKETSFSSILAIHKNQSDKTPKYYTSEIFARDLEASKIEANPYLINYALNNSCIVKIYLDEIIKNVKSFKEEELKLGVEFIRNNFLLYEESGLESNTNVVVNNPTSQINQNEINNLNSKITLYEQALLSFDLDVQIRPRPFSSFVRIFIPVGDEMFMIEARRNIEYSNAKNELKNQIINRLNEFKNQLNLIKTPSTIEPQPTQINLVESKKKIFLNRDKLTNDTKKVLDKVISAETEDDIIDMENVFVDCILLVKYIDWVLTKPNLEDIETNGVIPPEELSVFKSKDKITNPLDIESGRDIELPPSTKYYTYRVVRLSIPATFEASLVTYSDRFGNPQTIQTDRYGLVGEFCALENSFKLATNLYNINQLGPCEYRQEEIGIGGGGGGGVGVRNYENNFGYYDNEIRNNNNFIDSTRDFSNIQE